MSDTVRLRHAIVFFKMDLDETHEVMTFPFKLYGEFSEEKVKKYMREEMKWKPFFADSLNIEVIYLYQSRQDFLTYCKQMKMKVPKKMAIVK